MFVHNMRSVVLPFKDQASADIVRVQLKDFSQKIHTTEQAVYVSQKIEQDLKLREAKLSVVKQQCLVYKSQCDLCDAGYVGFTRRHLHQLVQEHRRSTLSIIANILRDKHFLPPGDRTNLTSYFMKCFLKEYVKCDHYDVNKLPSLRLV